MKITTLPRLLLLGTTLTLPLASLAQPPAWAGKGKGPMMQQQENHEREYRRDDRRHRDYRDYRYSDRERDALRRHLSRRDYQSLPPGLQKKVARGGQLPPGWQKKLQVGHTFNGNLDRYGQRLPVYDDIRRIDGVTDVVIDNEVVRVLDATQTIIDVFGIR